MSGNPLWEVHPVMAASPAVLTTAAQFEERIPAFIAALSVAEPTTIASILDLTSGDILVGVRTKATTWCLWASSAGIIREPTLPVMPDKNTRMVVGMINK
ncbi:hypothetical protein IFR04_007231 [Cadophora malorum]|uniref:Uncharacterized protein n=1 Tax=Cadophora malorum TaxID=108018 RepID=A0A8H7TH67_9HELO|nr:hypothetical protein IFR04_007231 [Cadophora malorum]